MNITRGTKISIAVMAILFTSIVIAHSLPRDWEVQEGTADIEINDTTMTINADDPATIINFSSFDISDNETVFVNLPSGDARILNRVNGSSQSELLGSLDCNGLFVLVNTSGIHVGPDADITAKSLILSTRDITDSDFLNGRYIFDKLSDAELDVLLLNEGNITISEGGFGVLIAGGIENRGFIVAPAGRIILAGGNAIRLEMSADGLISVAIDEKTAESILDYNGNPILDQIKNTGTLQTEGGQVILDAESLPEVFEKAINLEGIVKATKIVAVPISGVSPADMSPNTGGVVRMEADEDIIISANIEAYEVGVTGKRDVEINTSITAQGGDIVLHADSDADGKGEFTQNAELIEATGDGDISIDGSEEMKLRTVKTENGAIKIGTDVAPEAITGEPHFVHAEGDLEITGVREGEKVTVVETSRGDVLRYATDGDVTLEAEKGSIRDLTEASIPANRLELIANDVSIASRAVTTHIANNEGDILIEELIELGENMVTLKGAGIGEATYIKTNNITLEAQKGDIDTAAGIVIPGNQVKLSAQRIGSIDTPVGINANLTYINRIQGDIDISAMWGLGSTIFIRGPDPDPADPDVNSWGAISYNKGSDLVLEAENVTLSENDPSYLYGNITFNNFSCSIPDKEIYFEAGKTYTFTGSLYIGMPERDFPVHLKSSEEGKQWHINIESEDYTIERIAVSDSRNVSNLNTEIYASPSYNRGNNTGWNLNTAYTSGAANDWNNTASWDPSGTPGASDTVAIDHTITLTQNEAASRVTVRSGGTLAVGSYTLDVGGRVIINSGGTLTMTSGEIQLTGNWTGTGTFTSGTGTVTFDGTADQTLAGTNTWYNLTIANSGDGASGGAWPNAAQTVSGTFTIDPPDGKTFTWWPYDNDTYGDVVIASGATLLLDPAEWSEYFNVKGDWTNSGTFTAASGTTVHFIGTSADGDGIQAVNTGGTGTGQDFADLTHSGSGTLQLVTNAIDIDGTLTNSAGTIDTNGQNLTATTAFVNGASGTLLLQGGETVTEPSTHTAGSTIVYDGTDNDTANTYTIPDWSFKNFIVNGAEDDSTKADTFQAVAGGITNGIGEDFTVTSGIFDLNGGNIAITGDAIVTDTIKLEGGETITAGSADWQTGCTAEYDGSGSYSNLAAGNTYYNLILNNSSGTWALNGALDVDGALTISAGTLNANGQNINLAGNWTNSANFVTGSGTVTLDGSGGPQIIYGTNTWNKLTITPTATHEVQFEAGSTQTIEDALSINAPADGTLTLKSTTTGGQWYAIPRSSIGISGGSRLAVQDCVLELNSTRYDIGVSFGGTVNWKTHKEEDEPVPVQETQEAELEGETPEVTPTFLPALRTLDDIQPFMEMRSLYTKCTTNIIVISGEAVIWQRDKFGRAIAETRRTLTAGQRTMQSGTIMASPLEDKHEKKRSGIKYSKDSSAPRLRRVARNDTKEK